MIPTLFSVSYAGLWGQCRLDLKAFLARAGALGYPAVELMGKRPHLSILDTDRRAVDELREAASAAGVAIATIAGYTNFTLACDSEVPGVEIQVGYVRQLANLARQLDARIVRVFTGYLVQHDGFQRDWDLCVRAVRECAQVVADRGVILGVQNHHDVGVGVDSYVEFLDEVDHPNCRAMFDPWAPALHGEDLRSCARRLAPRMVQTTLADYVRLPRYRYQPGLVNYQRLDDAVRAVPLGEGFLDLAGFFAGLGEGGFEGYVAYEMCSPLRGGGGEENLDRAARASLETIRRFSAQGRPPENAHETTDPA
jgi:sugar phosphate isomerase/epimerase